MPSPYKMLDVSVDADDAEIKQAYLRKVKDNPPERDAERFQAINTAYQTIKDHKSRLRYALFQVEKADFESLLERALVSTNPSQPGAEQFIKLLRATNGD